MNRGGKIRTTCTSTKEGVWGGGSLNKEGVWGGIIEQRGGVGGGIIEQD